MKKDFCFILASIFILTIVVQKAVAQKTFLLNDRYKHPFGGKEKAYDLTGSELYLIANDTNIFIPRDAPYEFQTSSSIDSMVYSKDTLKPIHVLIRNSRSEFIIPFSRSTYRRYNLFGITVVNDHNQNHYIVSLLETCGIGFSSSDMVVKRNSLWKKRYYERSKKP